MFLVCHVIKQDHVIKGSGDHDVDDSLKVSHHPSKFGSHRHRGIGDIMLLVCHVISSSHVIKESSICRSQSRKVIILPSSVAIGVLVGKI